jgi:predicted ATPase/DNA-binding winged helix-turn-helix (wHTH) protein
MFVPPLVCGTSSLLYRGVLCVRLIGRFRKVTKKAQRNRKTFQKVRLSLDMREEKQYFFGPFRLDLTNECLWQGGKEIRLHPKAFGLLQCLLNYPGQMVTKESLLETLWPGVHVTEAILSVYVAEIRKALGEDPKKPVFIETLHRRGYRFIAPVNLDRTTGLTQTPADSGASTTSLMPEAATAIGTAPIIGREKALAFLLEKLDTALQGKGSVVFVTGPAGIGKTRLVRELRNHAAQRGCQWLGSKYEKARNHPYGAWVDMLRGHFQQRDAKALRILMGPYATQLASIFPEVLPHANSTSSVAPQDSEIERRRRLEAWTHLLIQISREAPLLLCLDDVQWAGSLELLPHLARNIGNQRVLVLVAYRDDELKMNATLWKTVLEMNRERLFHPLPLEPLKQDEVVQLISQRVEKTVAAHLVDVIYQRTQGNPFFVEEFLRLLQERKLIVHTEAGVDLKKSAWLEMPESVKAVISERVERLGQNAVELLRMASVIGREFPLRVLEEFAGQKEEDLIGVMDACEGAGVISSTRGLGEEKYAFTHDLLQEALYESIGPARRRRYHLRIAQTIEKLYAFRLEDWYEALPHHFREGNDTEKAVAYSHRAGVKAASHCAYREAALHFEHALHALEHLPDGRHKLEQALAIRIDLGPALIAIGSYLAPEVEQNYIHAEKLCEQLGETAQLYPVLWTLSRIRHWRGELLAARQLAEQLLSLARREQDSQRLLEAHHTLWAILLDMGELPATKRYAEQGFRLYDRIRHGQLSSVYGGHDPGVCSQIHAAKALWLLGYPDQALRTIETALTMATELSHPYTLWLALMAAIWIYHHRGNRHAAQDHVEKLFELAREQQHQRWIKVANFLQGWLMVEQGQWERGITQMRQGESELVIEARQQTYHAALMAQACLKAKQIEQADSVLTKELKRARDTGIRYYEAELHRIKGEVLLRRSASSQKEAETCFHQAIDLSRNQGAKSLELRAIMSLSRSWQKQGKKAEARKKLQVTYEWFTEGFATADLREAKELLKEKSKAKPSHFD